MNRGKRANRRSPVFPYELDWVGIEKVPDCHPMLLPQGNFGWRARSPGKRKIKHINGRLSLRLEGGFLCYFVILLNNCCIFKSGGGEANY